MVGAFSGNPMYYKEGDTAILEIDIIDLFTSETNEKLIANDIFAFTFRSLSRHDPDHLIKVMICQKGYLDSLNKKSGETVKVKCYKLGENYWEIID